MKKNKIITLTSILGFILNITTSNIFAQDILTNSNKINTYENINTIDSKNKSAEENIDNKKTDKNSVENQDNKINSKSTEESKILDSNLKSEDNSKLKQQSQGSIRKSQLAENINPNKEKAKKVIDTISSNNISDNSQRWGGGGNYEPNEIFFETNPLILPLESNTNDLMTGVSTNVKPSQWNPNPKISIENSNVIFNKIGNYKVTYAVYVNANSKISKTRDVWIRKPAEIPDPNLKEALNQEIAKQTRTQRSKNQVIYISELKDLKGFLDLHAKGIKDLTGIENLTGIDTLNVNGNHITDVSPLSSLTNLQSLLINYNCISNVKPLNNLTQLKMLDIDGNNISDISSLKALRNLTGLTAKYQNITNKEVKSIGSKAIVDNIVKGVNGEFINILNGNGYTYDSLTHKVTFTGINKTGNKEYSFNQLALIGQSNGTFAGTVTQKIVYEQIVEIPDQNLKVALNQEIARQTNTFRANNQDITILELQNLKGSLNFNGRNIENLKGLEYCTSIESLYLDSNNISNLTPLQGLGSLQFLSLSSNKIINLEPLKGLKKLISLALFNNKISNLEPLRELRQLNNLNLGKNKINDISVLFSLNELKRLNLDNNHIIDFSQVNNLNVLNSISIKNQQYTLNKVIVDSGSIEIENPIILPNSYSDNLNFSVSPNGKILYSKVNNKLSLTNLNTSNNEFIITMNATFSSKNNIDIPVSVQLILPVEHVSMIKVDLPTSMTFNVVTNTVDPITNHLKPTFVTSDYSINNRGKKTLTITPRYSVINQGGIDLVESIGNNDISKDNNVKISVKLKNLSNNTNILSVVNKANGTQFTVSSDSEVKLRFEPGVNGMCDVEKENLSDTKTTTGRIRFTIEN
ncbi:leucine-rich repeat domain-containing protein (plasmid) [Clostridium perfringens]